MPRTFCFNLEGRGFRDLAYRYNISPAQLDFYASVYADRNGIGAEEMETAMFGDGRTKAARAFRDYLKGRLDGIAVKGDPRFRTNGFANDEELRRARKVYTFYNGRRLDTITRGEFAVLMSLLPRHEVYEDYNGVRRVVFEQPYLDESVGKEGDEPTAASHDYRVGGTGYLYGERPVSAEGFLRSAEYRDFIRGAVLEAYGLSDLVESGGELVGNDGSVIDADVMRGIGEMMANTGGVCTTALLDRQVQARINELSDAGMTEERRTELAQIFAMNESAVGQVAYYTQREREAQADREKGEEAADDRQRVVGSDVYTFPNSGARYRLTTHDKRHIANLIAVNTSQLITELITNRDAQAAVFPGDLEGVTLYGMDRAALIKAVGLRRLVGVVRRQLMDLNPNMGFRAGMKYKMFNDGFERNILYGLGKLMSNEGVTLDYVKAQFRLSDQKDVNEILMQYALERGESEMYEDNDHKISSVSRLPAAVRRFIDTLCVRREDGSLVADREGYGVPQTVNGRAFLNFLYNVTEHCSSLDEIVAELRKHPQRTGVNDLLRVIDRESPQFDPEFATQVGSVLSFVRGSYGKYVREVGEDGVSRLVPVTLNERQVAEGILNTVQNEYLCGFTPLFRMRGNNRTLGRGVVDQTVMARLRENMAYVMGAVADSGDFGAKEHGDMVDAIAESLRMLGMPMFDEDVVKCGLYTDYGEVASAQDHPAYRAAVLISRVLDAFDSAAGEEIEMPLLDIEEEEEFGGTLRPTRAMLDLCDMFALYVEDSVEPFVYNNSSIYYTVQRSTRLKELEKSLDISTPEGREKAFRFLMEEFVPYRFHVLGDYSQLSEANWLRTCLETPLKVQEVLDVDGREYDKFSRPDFMVSALAGYRQQGKANNTTAAYTMVFGERNAMYTITGPKHALSPMTLQDGRVVMGSERILDGLAELANQDIMRMKAVFERSVDIAGDGREGFKSGPAGKGVENFDLITDGGKDHPHTRIVEAARANRAFRDGLTGDEKAGKVTREMLVKDGRLVTLNSGMSFRMLEELNDEIVQGTELGQMILDKISGTEVDNDHFVDVMRETLLENMQKMVTDEIARADRAGLYDPDGNGGLRYLDQFIDETPGESLDAVGRNGKRAAERRRALADQFMTEFLWNDYYARSQMLKMLVSDPAYFKNSDDMYNRAKGLTSPGYKLNPEARDFDGRRYSDGKLRSIYITDETVRSVIIPNVRHFYEHGIELIDEELRSPSTTEDRRIYLNSKRRAYESMRDTVPQRYERMRKTSEGQSWSSPTATRKKLGCAGHWTRQMDEQLKRVLDDKDGMTFDDVDFMIQVAKPVTFGYESQDYNTGAGATMDRAKVPTYYKTSEMMIALAGAMMSGSPQANILRAMYDFMEGSAYEEDGTYNMAGIDTILVQSGVKTGASMVLDLSVESLTEAAEGKDGGIYQAALDRMRNVCYDADGAYTDAVHEMPIESYTFQQENPAHLTGYQPMGTQGRAIVVSDIDGESSVTVRGEDGKASDYKSEYWDILGRNIRGSFDRLVKTLGLGEENPAARNRRISQVLKDAILMDQNPDLDLYWAVSLNGDGEFNLPMDDFMIGVRFQNLVNAIVRDNINKQRMPGGPVVQMASYGFAEELNVRFQDRDGNLVETFSEFCRREGLSVKDEEAAGRYKEEVLVAKGADRLAHFEVYLNIPTDEMKLALLIREGSPLAGENGERVGTYMTPDEAVAQGIISEEALKVIAERIPTENKYSMIPMRIVGFMSDASGEAIVMPKEITLLTGSDFDVDKMFAALKDFRRVLKIDENGLRAMAERYVEERYGSDMPASREGEGLTDDVRHDYIRNAMDVFRGFADETEGGELREKSLERPEMRVFFERNLYDFLGVSFEEITDGEAGRMNRAHDIMWGMMTSEGSTDKLFDPGGFDNLKKASNIARIMQLDDYTSNVGKYGTYDELSSKSIEELEAILARSQRMHPLRFSSLVHYQQENVAAKKMIGWAANNNTAHALMQDMDIRLNLPKSLRFGFGGVEVSGQKLDPTFTLDLDARGDRNGFGVRYVSKSLGSVSAATVDAAKYQTLKAMNLNEFTANPFFLMVRLGFPEELVTLFMTMPSIREMAEIYAKERGGGSYIGAEEVADMYRAKHPDRFVRAQQDGRTVWRLKETNIRPGFSRCMFSKEDMLKVHQGDRTYSAYYNDLAVETFVKMASVGNELFKLSHVTKINSLNEAFGSTLGDVLVNSQQYMDFIDKYRTNPNERDSIFVGRDGDSYNKNGVLNVIRRNAVIWNFYSTTYGDGTDVFPGMRSGEDGNSPVGIGKQVYGTNTPYYNAGFRNGLRKLLGSIKARPDAATINEFASAWTQFVMYSGTTEEGNAVFDASPEAYDDLVGGQEGGFLDEAYRLIEENRRRPYNDRNPLLSNLWFTAPNSACPVMTLNCRLGEAGPDFRSDMSDAWLDLYNDPNTRGFAMRLANYAVLRSGLGSSENTLASIMPAQMKADIAEYRDGLVRANMAQEQDIDTDNLVVQFLRNRSYDRRLVPHLELNGRGQIHVRRGSGNITFGEGVDLSAIQARRQMVNGKWQQRYAPVIVVNGEVLVKVSTEEQEATGGPEYAPSSPLGVRGWFTEIDPSRGMNDESVFERYRDEYESSDGLIRTVADEAEMREAVRQDGDGSEWYDVSGVIDRKALLKSERDALSKMVKGDRELYMALREADDREAQARAITDFVKRNGIKFSNKDKKLFKELMDKFC